MKNIDSQAAQMTDQVQAGEAPKPVYNVQDFAKEARGTSASGLINDYQSGFGEARGLLGGDNKFNESLGMNDKATMDAIRGKYSKDYRKGEARLAHTLKQAGQDDYLKRLSIASEMAGQEHQMNIQKEILRQKKKAANKAARGAMLGTVLGIVGAGGGALASGGNPMAISAGMSLGQGTGNAVGGM